MKSQGFKKSFEIVKGVIGKNLKTREREREVAASSSSFPRSRGIERLKSRGKGEVERSEARQKTQWSEWNRRSYFSFGESQYLSRSTSRTPLGQLGLPFILSGILFLASFSCSFSVLLRVFVLNPNWVPPRSAGVKWISRSRNFRVGLPELHLRDYQLK